ncbi:MAG TPA: glycoside hydrolase family 15 protein [Planctomycetota bacterium]|nr:glycoside hydrolase family 15 protein [Planctomycetota bacterium]
MPAPTQPIENHGVVGDMRTVALVGMDGAVDFLCWPRFDSPTVFASLLDPDKGGSFRIAPVLPGAREKQLYLPDTNILLTRFLSEHGVAEISDFMAISDDGPMPQALVRRVKCVRGTVDFQVSCAPRFDYGRAAHTVQRGDGEAVFTSETPGRLALRLRTPVPFRVRDGAVHARFTLAAGESAAFVLEDALAFDASPTGAPDFVAESFKATHNFWHGWIGRCKYRGRWQEMVRRSALVLKLLTSREYGSVVAAATFGLPEQIGGERNWDYRYTWIRDASFTVYALMRLGYGEEAAAFMRWIEARCDELGPDGSLQIMYGIDGRHELPEQMLGHLSGYRGSVPVRVGNAAFDQLQLDIYGELMDSVYLHNKYGEPVHHDLWVNLVRLVDYVCENWQKPDEGIWEVRGGRQDFLYSRLMCWVAVDRAIRLANKRSFPGPMDRWQRVRNDIYHEIFDRFWDPERKAFVQHLGSKSMDASVLMMPLVKFISPSDPRWLSTLAAVDEDLVDDSLVYRYRIGEGASDGLRGDEGTFCICSFWYVESLARSGDLQQARFIFEKTLGYASHLGLYAEELGPSGEHLGNFPQAFTHLALISAAHYLDRALSASGERG